MKKALTLILISLLIANPAFAKSTNYTSTGNFDYGALMVDGTNLTIATGWNCEHDYLGMYDQQKFIMDYDSWDGTYASIITTSAPYGAIHVEYTELPNPFIGDEMVFDLGVLPEAYAWLIWYDCVDTDGIYHRSQFSFKYPLTDNPEYGATSSNPIFIQNGTIEDMPVKDTTFTLIAGFFIFIVSAYLIMWIFKRKI